MRVPKYIQYSKKLCLAITIFWIVIRVGTLIALIVRPSIVDGIDKFLIGIDDVMMCNLGFYCGNSVAEKGIIKYFEAKANSTNEDAGPGENG